jgi:hypothetical protein
LIGFGPLVLEKKISKNFCVFLFFRYYLPLENGYPLRLKTPESYLSKDDVYQVWLNVALWFWGKDL